MFLVEVLLSNEFDLIRAVGATTPLSTFRVNRFQSFQEQPRRSLGICSVSIVSPVVCVCYCGLVLAHKRLLDQARRIYDDVKAGISRFAACARLVALRQTFVRLLLP